MRHTTPQWMILLIHVYKSEMHVPLRRSKTHLHQSGRFCPLTFAKLQLEPPNLQRETEHTASHGQVSILRFCNSNLSWGTEVALDRPFRRYTGRDHLSDLRNMGLKKGMVLYSVRSDSSERRLHVFKLYLAQHFTCFYVTGAYNTADVMVQ
jgi:hypothetical protein